MQVASSLKLQAQAQAVRVCYWELETDAESP
jgi:hypothetical protein